MLLSQLKLLDVLVDFTYQHQLEDVLIVQLEVQLELLPVNHLLPQVLL